MKGLITPRLIWGPLLVIAVLAGALWFAAHHTLLFFLSLPLLWLFTGLLDVLRNRPLTFYLLQRYFGSQGGLITWALSPLNLFLDAFAAPNRKIYRLNDYPEAWRAEIEPVLATFDRRKAEIISYIDNSGADREGKQRSMYLAKWYGTNTDGRIEEFLQPFRYIKTIGVSTFGAGAMTRWHFGPLRMTYRILYNLEPCESRDCHIRSMGQQHFWQDDPFFSFDDTLLHKSVNLTDTDRHCAYIDIIRPTLWTPLYSGIVSMARLIFRDASPAFYRRWKMLS